MKKHIAKMLAAVAMTWLSGSAIAGDPCSPCDTTPCARGGWYASAGVLYLKQTGSRDLSNGTNNYSDVALDGTTELLSTSVSEFDHNYQWSGRAEFGVKDTSGFGLRVRYFWIHDSSSISLLDNSGTQSDPNFPGVAYNEITGTKFLTANPLGVGFGTVGTATSPSLFTADSSLTLRAADFDITSDCHRGNLELTWFAGLRWLYINQSYNAYESIQNEATFEFPNVLPTGQSLNSNHTINAYGPTVGVEGRYGIRNNLKAVASTRFGILYAEGFQRVDVVKTGVADVFQPPVAPISGAEGRRCFGLPFGELELGGEYATSLGCDGPELFVRGTILSQAYWGAGTAARVNGSNNPGNEDLIFFGFSASVGIRY